MAILTRSVLIEAYWSVRIVERAYLTLQRAYKIIIDKLQGLRATKEMVLQMAVKAVNDIAGLDGLVLTLLIFGTYP